jgi:prophage regulatory protein
MDRTSKFTAFASKRRPSAPLATGEAEAALSPEDQIIREPECRRISGLSRSTRWRLERAGKFPRRRQISPGCSGWLASEIRGWVASR